MFKYNKINKVYTYKLKLNNHNIVIDSYGLLSEEIIENNGYFLSTMLNI